MKTKLLVFLDYANINSLARNSVIRLDYRHLLEYLVADRFLIDAYAYVPIDPRNEHGLDRTIEDLWKTGYSVQTKVGTVAGESYKCNMDVEMAIDILNAAYTIRPDIVVIASGDGDMLPVVQSLRKMGIRAEVASFEAGAARKLTIQASGFISLDQYVDEVMQVGETPNFEASLPHAADVAAAVVN
jgi:uncharacterized LabA/DUF88 family protein